MELSGFPVHPGSAGGRLLVLDRPLSFWGGVDAETGCVSDPRNPQYGERLTGRILVMERAVGSSSSSAIMLELLRNGEGVAPAAVVLGSADAILVLGVLVAEELGYPGIPLVEIGEQGFAKLSGTDGAPARVCANDHSARLWVETDPAAICPVTER